ncbi:MAG: RNA-binding S4 domain-containing protein [Reichenbachiella sp.]
MEEFKLKEGEEYIDLNNLLKILGWVITGGEAKSIISEGNVKVNDQVETRIRKKIRIGEIVVFGEDTVTVI